MLRRFVCRNLFSKYNLLKKTFTEEFPPDRIYLQQGSKTISFWNDVPLKLQGDTVNCCVEIPHSTTAKMEVIKQIQNHPIRQDTKKNKSTGKLELRHYAVPPMFNYGYLPQTWQQDITLHEGLYTSKNVQGDNDPLDIVQLSTTPKQTAEIFQCKVLGSFCLIDQGEIDWKVLVIDSKEAEKLNVKTIADFADKARLEAIKQWFKKIKTYDGKKANQIAYDQKIFGKDETLALISSMHEEWKKIWTSDNADYKQRRLQFHFTK